MTSLRILRSALVFVLMAAPGCERAAAERAQLAARVNGTGIALREVAAGAASQGAFGAAGRTQALEKVIERELLVQQALHAGLERDPQVMESIENARRHLLAQAWLEKVAAGRSVSRDEVREFYAENPALFAERRVYRLRELVVTAPSELTEVLRAQAARARDLDEVAAWLRERNARFSSVALTLAAEQVPLSRLPRLARMKDGEIEVFAAPEEATVLQLVLAEDAALSEAEAAPEIERFLGEVATIEYLGEFKRNN
jgi:EpsD family peptidyl-prolyl cis-trans isomerase